MKFSIRTFIWLVVILAILIAGVMAMLPQPVDVELATAVEAPLRVSVQEDGKTRIREKYIVSTPVSGRLTRIDLQPGDDVVYQQTLLAVILPSEPEMLDARDEAQAKARVQSAEAAVKRADSGTSQAAINFDLAKSKFDRAKKLSPQKVISENEFDTAEAEFLASELAIQAAKFDSEIARFELEMARAAAQQFEPDEVRGGVKPFEIFSPIEGKVLRVFQESSTVVTSGTPLIELGDPGNLEIEIDVLSTDAVRIKPGADLTIDHWGGEQALQGKVRVIEPAAFTKISSLGVEEQRVNIIADFDEPKERLASLGDGYRVEAKITVAEAARVLQVPNSSLFRYQRKWHVFMVQDNRAVLVPVEIGLQNDSHTQILSGLDPGSQVIVYPNDKIESGTGVHPVN